MRSLIACVGLFAALYQPLGLQAQTFYEEKTNSFDNRQRQTRSRMNWQDELIFQRAAYRARQRMARMEMRSWLGNSALRPQVHQPAHTSSVNMGDVVSLAEWIPFEWHSLSQPIKLCTNRVQSRLQVSQPNLHFLQIETSAHSFQRVVVEASINRSIRVLCDRS